MDDIWPVLAGGIGVHTATPTRAQTTRSQRCGCLDASASQSGVADESLVCVFAKMRDTYDAGYLEICLCCNYSA